MLRATTTLAWSLGIQTALLLVWLACSTGTALVKSFRAWRPSLFAGFLGAFASQFWFIGFSLTSAANVRTLALVEVLFAQAVSRRLFAQSTTRGRRIAGMGSDRDRRASLLLFGAANPDRADYSWPPARNGAASARSAAGSPRRSRTHAETLGRTS